MLFCNLLSDGPNFDVRDVMSELVSSDFDNQASALSLHLSWVMEEKLLLMLLVQMWDQKMEGRKFELETKTGLSFVMKRGDRPFSLKLEDGKWNFIIGTQISMYSKLQRSKPFFEGGLKISGKTERKQAIPKSGFYTDLQEIDWDQNTRIKIGPIKLPVDRVSNLIAGVLKKHLARYFDKLLNELALQNREIPRPALTDLNRLIPGSDLFINRLHLETGYPASGNLPVFADVIIGPGKVEGASLKVTSTQSLRLGPSLSEIKVAYSWLPRLMPTVETKVGMWTVTVRLGKVYRSGNKFCLSVFLSGSISGSLVVVVPVDEQRKLELEKCCFEEAKFDSFWQRTLFGLFREFIRKRILQKIFDKLNRFSSGLRLPAPGTINALGGQSLDLIIEGERDIFAGENYLSLAFQLSLAHGKQPMLSLESGKSANE